MRKINWLWIAVIVVIVVVGISRSRSAEPQQLESVATEEVTPQSPKPQTKVEMQEPAWLEMPAVRKDGRYPNAEVITVMSEGERNYTLYYDFDTYTSMWVAYPLEARHMGDYERPGAWDYNPYISVSEQVNLCSRSYVDDYSRGHLIPNASRDGDREMQLQTFYVTNSVPQVQDGFNGGIWMRLEAGLQRVAQQSVVYIVTGVAFEKMHEECEVKYTAARNEPEKRVPVPNYFYKVALKVAYDASGKVTDAQSVGFWFENRSYKGGFADYTESVDTIEAWTGFDFFPALSDGIEERVERNRSWSAFESF